MQAVCSYFADVTTLHVNAAGCNVTVILAMLIVKTTNIVIKCNINVSGAYCGGCHLNITYRLVGATSYANYLLRGIGLITIQLLPVRSAQFKQLPPN